MTTIYKSQKNYVGKVYLLPKEGRAYQVVFQDDLKLYVEWLNEGTAVYGNEWDIDYHEMAIHHKPLAEGGEIEITPIHASKLGLLLLKKEYCVSEDTINKIVFAFEGEK